jgi:hypothetical protein
MEVLLAVVFVLTLSNLITFTRLDPLFFWQGLTALQRAFATIDIIIVVVYTFLYEIRVFFWCVSREERRLDAEQRVLLLH